MTTARLSAGNRPGGKCRSAIRTSGGRERRSEPGAGSGERRAGGSSVSRGHTLDATRCDGSTQCTASPASVNVRTMDFGALRIPRFRRIEK